MQCLQCANHPVFVLATLQHFGTARQHGLLDGFERCTRIVCLHTDMGSAGMGCLFVYLVHCNTSVTGHQHVTVDSVCMSIL